MRDPKGLGRDGGGTWGGQRSETVQDAVPGIQRESSGRIHAAEDDVLNEHGWEEVVDVGHARDVDGAAEDESEEHEKQDRRDQRRDGGLRRAEGAQQAAAGDTIESVRREKSGSLSGYSVTMVIS